MAEMTSTRKRLAILVVMVGSALIAQRVYSLATDDGAAVQPDEPAAPRLVRSAAPGSAHDGASPLPAGLHIDRLDARKLALSERLDPWSRAQQITPFDSVTWQAPAPKSPAPAPPQKPVAPPFAYVYMGGLTQDGVRTAFFTQGDRIIAVKAGDTVDATYRIDQMTDKQMKLTYLPLNETLVVGLGGRQ